MAKKNEARHPSKCKLAAESAVIAMSDTKSNVPLQKRKEDAKQILYLNRV